MGRVKQRDDKTKQKVNENPASSPEYTHGQTPRGQTPRGQTARVRHLGVRQLGTDT